MAPTNDGGDEAPGSEDEQESDEREGSSDLLLALAEDPVHLGHQAVPLYLPGFRGGGEGGGEDESWVEEEGAKGDSEGRLVEGS
jgi:hypothetical protein